MSSKDRRGKRTGRGNGSGGGSQQGRGQRNSRSGNARWHNRRDDLFAPRKVFHPSKAVLVPQEQIRETEEAIRAFKEENRPVCPYCNAVITDLTTAIQDKKSGQPVHFDCVLDALAESERPADGDKIAYIGQGRFAVIAFASPHDTRHFTIKRIIDWEEKDSRSPWRGRMAQLYSQVR